MTCVHLHNWLLVHPVLEGGALQVVGALPEQSFVDEEVRFANLDDEALMVRAQRHAAIVRGMEDVGAAKEVGSPLAVQLDAPVDDDEEEAGEGGSFGDGKKRKASRCAGIAERDRLASLFAQVRPLLKKRRNL